MLRCPFHHTTMLVLLATLCTPAVAHSAQDELYGDGFEGFDRESCDAGIPSQPSDVIAYAKALDLCAVTTSQGQTAGVISAVLSRADGTGVPSIASHAVRPHFGNGTQPAFGSSMVVLSTGAAAGKGDVSPTFVPFEPGYSTGTSSPFPADWIAANGGIQPTAPGCAQLSGTAAHDPVMLTMDVRVPENAHSFSINVNFFGADFPEWVCGSYNDVFVALLDSSYAGIPANPVDKNLAGYTLGSALVVPVGVNLAWGNTGLFTQCLNGTMACGGTSGAISTCVSTVGLVDTGMDDPHPDACNPNAMVGGGTGWLVTRGNVVPGETITLRFAIWDTGDGTSDSLVLLDNFRWGSQTVTPGTTLR